MNKRLFSVILSLLLVLSLLPLEAFAGDTGNPTSEKVNVKLNGKNIKDYVDNGSQEIAEWTNAAGRTETLQNAYDTVYLGGKAYYVLSMSGSSDNYIYNFAQNIETAATYKDDDDNPVDAENAMFLLSDAPVGTSEFYSSNNDSHYWSKHTTDSLWDKLNGDGKTAYLGSSGMNLSDAEYAAILRTTKADVKVVTAATDGYSSWSGTFNQFWSDSSSGTATTRFSSALLWDKIYPLSVSEIANPAYGLNTRQAMKTYGASAKYWLRSSYAPESVGNVHSAGGFGGNGAMSTSVEVRPALNLNLESVLFASDAAAGSGKSNASGESVFTDFLASAETNQWKLTLTDSSKTLTDATLLKNGTEYLVAYSGASTGANTWLSAIFVDKSTDEVLHYGKLKALTDAADSSGVTASFQIPGGVELGEGIEMQVFVETVSESQTGTDYASAVEKFNSAKTVESIDVTGATTTYTAGETFKTDGVTVTATLSDSSPLVLTDWTFDYPTYTASANDQKFHIESAEQETQTVKIKSGFVNSDGTSVTYDQSVTVNGIGKNDKAELSLSQNNDSTWKISVIGLSDGVVAEYSTDSGESWTEVGTNLDSISATDKDVTYQVRPKADIANDRATGTASSITVPGTETTLYKVDITVNKDGVEWADNTQRIDLRSTEANGNNYYYYKNGASIVKPGTYDVYAINFDGEMVKAVASLNVNNDVNTTVYYYTLTFDKNQHENDVSTVVVLKNTNYTPTNEITAATSGASGLGLTFTGYKENDTVITSDGETTSTGVITDATNYKAQYIVNSIANMDNATCSVTEIIGGQELAKPEDTSVVIGGYTVKGEWSLFAGTIGSASVTETPYAYIATFTAPDGYTFEDKAWGTGWTRTSDTILTRTFDQMTAGYPVTVTGIPEGITSLTYTVGQVTRDLAVSGSTAVFAAPTNTLYENASIRTSDGVKYVGTIDARRGSASVALGTDMIQQAPVITSMMPNDKGTGVATQTDNIKLTFDQKVTLSADTVLTMYQYASDNARTGNQYTNSFVITLSNDMLSADGKTLTLPVKSFLNGSTAMTLANNNYYTLDVPEGSFTAAVGGKLKTAAFTDYMKASTSGDLAVVTYSLSNPANGVLYASNVSGVVTYSASGKVNTGTAYAGEKVTFTSNANVGYKLSGYRITWNGKRYDVNVGGTIPADLAGIVELNDETMTVKTDSTVNAFTVEAVFAVDSSVVYTLTPVETEKTVAIGNAFTPEYTLSPSGAKVAFSSSDKSVASVDSNGKITGVKAGTATIYAKAPTGAVLCSWTITVIPRDSQTPTITTGEAKYISANGATLTGSFDANGLTVTEAGVYVNGKLYSMSTVPADGKVSVDVTGLSAGTEYNYSVYVKTPTKTYYDINQGKSTEAKFTTKEETNTIFGSIGTFFTKVKKFVDNAFSTQNSLIAKLFSGFKIFEYFQKIFVK